MINLLVVSICLGLALPAQGLGQLQFDVVEHTLPNGMKLLVSENHRSPVFSALIRFKVGSVNEHEGITGISHLLEHLLFKGTKSMGTRNFEAEQRLLAKIDSVGTRLDAERKKRGGGDPLVLSRLEGLLDELNRKHGELAVRNELWKTYLRNGAVGLNAGTGNDGTTYLVSLPSNRLELWAMMESDRLANPVFREFYPERDVVKEERRLRIETQPDGTLYEEFLATAFKAHPYRNPVIGWMSDLNSITREDVEEYFKTHCCPANAIITVVGDVDPDNVISIVEKYFGQLSGPEAPPPVRTLEPPQRGERRVEVEFDAEPEILVGYHVPEIGTDDYYVVSVISDILTDGRSSRLYRRFVEEEKLASSVWSSREPGELYSHLLVFGITPLQSRTCGEVEDALYEEIDRLRTQPVETRELEKVVSKAKARLVRALDSNMGLAFTLTRYEALTGDWRFVETLLDRLGAVTEEDIMRVANQYLIPSNRVVATLVPPETDQ